MRIAIVAVGRLKRGPELELLESYRRRMRWPVTIREVEEKRPLPAAERRKREAELIRSALPNGAVTIALDETGKQVTSEAFARRLEGLRTQGTRNLAFAIGGADGLDEGIRKQADHIIAFGTMTWPHMLARAMLLEQLYRAEQILAGHPYHKG